MPGTSRRNFRAAPKADGCGCRYARVAWQDPGEDEVFDTPAERLVRRVAALIERAVRGRQQTKGERKQMNNEDIQSTPT